LSKLTSDPRSAIRKSSLEVLFNILKDHGHLFSLPFWTGVFDSVIFPIFTCVSDKRDMQIEDDEFSPASRSPHSEGSTWDSETSVVAAQCLVDLFVSFFDIVRSHLPAVVSILTGFIRSPVQGPASTGVAALMRLASDLGSRLSQNEWRDIFLALKEAATSSVPAFMKVLRSMDKIEVPGNAQSYSDLETSSDHILTNDDLEDDNLQTAQYVVSRLRSHIAMQLLVVQVSPPISIHRYTHTYI
jgi:brefeldin A-inhibited guanine nucleotide-exchange protein